MKKGCNRILIKQNFVGAALAAISLIAAKAAPTVIYILAQTVQAAPTENTYTLAGFSDLEHWKEHIA